MKLLPYLSSLIVLVFLTQTDVLSQGKPQKVQKTYDHVAFGKKVYGNLSAGMDQAIFLPDDKALAFISSKTGTPLEQLKKEREANKEYLPKAKAHLQRIKAGGLMIASVELVKVDHSQLTMGNIIVQVGAGATMKRIEFGNCIQTDVTWVLGDYMGLEGQRGMSIEPPVEEIAPVATAPAVAAPVVAAVATPAVDAKVKYAADVPLIKSESTYKNKDLFDKPMRGYIVDAAGVKTEAVIKYQKPSSMFSATSALLLYKIAYNEPGFTEDETTNFIAARMKNELSAFFVNGHLYVPIDKTVWGILLQEGAIRESKLVTEVKKKDGQIGYVESTRIHKRDLSSLDVLTMSLTFKGNMSSFVSDNAALAAKISARETGYEYMNYQKIVTEYNTWFDTQYPDKLVYFYSEQ